MFQKYPLSCWPFPGSLNCLWHLFTTLGVALPANFWEARKAGAGGQLAKAAQRLACPLVKQVLSGLIFWVLDPAFLNKVERYAEVKPHLVTEER